MGSLAHIAQLEVHAREQAAEVFEKGLAVLQGDDEDWVRLLYNAMVYRKVANLHAGRCAEEGPRWMRFIAWTVPRTRKAAFLAVAFVLGALAYRVYLGL